MAPGPVTQRPARVAHVIQNLNYGGMERVLHGLARALPRHGFEVHIIALEYLGRFAEGLETVATLHTVPPMSRVSLLYPNKLAELLRRIAPQVIHAHTGVWLKTSRAASLARVPVMVYTEHGRLDPVPLADRLIDNWASRNTDAVIAVSEPLARVLGQQVVHAPERIRIITNGVDVDQLVPPVDRAALRAELALPADALVIGSIGRLEPVKNYQLALRAFARLARNDDRLVLVLTGDGSSGPGLKALAGELGIMERVRFLGWRNDADRLYGAFDLFSLTSRSEGTSISLLEAMSTGVCPVVTDVGGNRVVLGQELEGLLVRDNDEDQLVALWSRCLADPQLRRQSGERARARVRTAFSLEAMVGRYAQLYRELLEARTA